MFATLIKLPRLKGTRLPKQATLKLPPRPRLLGDRQFVGKPPFPFSSWWEYVFNFFLLRQDVRWEATGATGLRIGGTVPDWVIEEKQWALFLDGPVHAFRDKTYHDKELRAAIEAMGWRVFVFTPPTFEYMKQNAQIWYRQNVEGRGIV